MKIGILTFHKVNNLGAVLQATALQNYIYTNIGKCEIIDFYPNNASFRDMSLFYKILRLGKRILMPVNSFDQYIKEKRFNEFREKYYTLSNATYYGDADIKENSIEYDILISGSDQIFNTTLTGNTSAFYLDFNKKAKKVSYASSFGRECISQQEIELVKKEIPKFSSVSVREKTAGDIIEKETSIKAQLVVDPVFLLNAVEWKKYCNEKIKLPSKYIFVYSMEVSLVLEKIVDKLRNIYNIPVIIVRGGGKSGRISGNEDKKCRFCSNKFVSWNSFFNNIWKKVYMCCS